MINLLQVLFPYFILFYFLDCFIYLRKGHLAYISGLGSKFHLKTSGLRFIGVLPLCRAYQCLDRPVFATEKGLNIRCKEQETGPCFYHETCFEHLAFDDFQQVESLGSQLVAKGRVLVDVHSPAAAGYLVDQFNFLKKTPAPRRKAEMARFLTAEMDLNAHDKARSLFPRLVSCLEILSLFLFMSVIILLPICLYSGFFTILIPVLLVILVCYLLTLLLSYLFYRKISAGPGDTISVLAVLLFSPMTAIHVLQHLTKQMLAHIDPIALSAQLLPLEEFKQIAKRHWSILSLSKAAGANEDMLNYIQLREGHLRELIRSKEITEQELTEPPRKRDPSALAYCQLCETEFMVDAQECPDCGIAVKAYDPY